jgi:hypothetical protein
MNVNKGHKKSPRRARASKPIERVPTRKLLESIKRDIEREIEKSKPEDKPKGKRGL